MAVTVTLMVCYSGKLDMCCVFVGRPTRKRSEAHGNDTSLTGSAGPLGTASGLAHAPRPCLEGALLAREWEPARESCVASLTLIERMLFSKSAHKASFPLFTASLEVRNLILAYQDSLSWMF